MKFGKYIQSASADWATPWYMEYKGLKKIISALESAGKGYTLLAAPPPDELDQSLKTAFFYKLDRELDKVNEFYMQKEAQLRSRLIGLSGKLRLYEKRKRLDSLKILKEAHVQFINDLAKLQKFVMVNFEGFRKILKKYDKRSKSATKDAYMARQVKIKPCFNSESLTELNDLVSNQLNEISDLIKTTNTLPLVSLDSEISLEIPKVAMVRSPTELHALDLDEFEEILLECIKTNQVKSLEEVLHKRKGEAYCAEDLEIMGRIFLNACKEASFEVLDCFVNNVPQLLELSITDDISDRTPLHELAISGRNKILLMLLEKGLNVDPEDNYGRRPIHYSAMYGHISSSMLLISHKTDLESPDHDGATPLVHAIRGGHVQLIELLLESGVKLEYFSEVVQNPLTVAVQIGNLVITEKLLNRGVQIRPDSHGLSPLHISCRMGYAPIALVLIKYGAPIDECDNFYGWQPIFFASSEGNLDCVRVLIQAGCNLDVKDENGWFPWTFALYHGHIEVAKLLEDSSQESNRTGQMPSGSVRPMAPSELFVSDTITSDHEIDSIPSLSLPPPIIPCRV
jgi:CDK inhibitor PHO81